MMLNENERLNDDAIRGYFGILEKYADGRVWGKMTDLKQQGKAISEKSKRNGTKKRFVRDINNFCCKKTIDMLYKVDYFIFMKYSMVTGFVDEKNQQS